MTDAETLAAAAELIRLSETAHIFPSKFARLCSFSAAAVARLAIRLANQLAVVHEHRIKTRAAADCRQKKFGQDSLTIQLESEARLLDLVCHESAGKEIAERLVAAEARVKALAEAIMTHRSQKADDRCIEDDDRLYEALGDGVKCDRRVGDKAAMLENCRRFIEQRCEAGGWKTYAELEARIKQLETYYGVPKGMAAEHEAAQCKRIDLSALAWHDKPTMPGDWWRADSRGVVTWRALSVTQADIDDGWPERMQCRWYGPIPPDRDAR